MVQLFGVAALAFVLPVAIWGWRLLTHRRLRRERIRLAFWVPAVLLAAGSAACLPRRAAWPLPAGLGGGGGDLLRRVPALRAGGTLPGVARAVVAVVAGLLALAAFAVVAGFGWRADDEDDSDEDDDADEREEGDEGRASISLGWLTHGFLSLKARLARLLTRRPPARATPRRELPPAHARTQPPFRGRAPGTQRPE